MARGNLYIVLFTTCVCGVFSVVVSLSAVTLKDRQDANRKLDRQKNVLLVAGLIQEGTRLTVEQADALFRDNIEAKLVELSSGAIIEEGAPHWEDPLAYEQRRALGDPALSSRAPDNPAKVIRLPHRAVVYLVKKNETLDSVVLPVEGAGLWSTLYGFLALEADLNTVKGITFYEHAETPGLGGEIDNSGWRRSWKGKRLADEAGKHRFHVKKGIAGDDPYAVDGLSGATLTANGVTHLVQFWLGEHGFGPFLQALSAETGGR